MHSYLSLIRELFNYGRGHDDRTGVGTLSRFESTFIHNMEVGFPLLTTKKVVLRWVFEELKWFLSGATYEPLLRAKGVDIWKEWATAEKCAQFNRQEGDLGPVYGHLWRSFDEPYRPYKGTPEAVYKMHEAAQKEVINASLDERLERVPSDQLARLIYDCNPASETYKRAGRRLIVSGWNPLKAQQVELPPCHTLWQVKLHDDFKTPGISLHLFARSIDSFLGLPYNIASYGLLLTMLGYVLNRKPDLLKISFTDLHLYSNHHAVAKEQLSRTPRDLPTVRVIPRDYHTGDPLQKLMSIQWEDIELTGYKPWPKLVADVAV